MITIFTPTYNRAYILPKLYDSLCNQTNQDFEWLVIDDGSTDNTEELLETWQSEERISMRLERVANGGKHRAINRGVEMACGELFFIVDSDDILTPDAVEWVIEEYKKIQDKKQFCGLSGSLATPKGHRIGGYFPNHSLDCSALDFRLKYGIKGDMAEVFRTDVLREFPFPEFDGERFCPEALIWNRIARRYIMRFCPKTIYITEYLPDGLTAKIARLRHDSPKASMLYYSELANSPIPFFQKIKAWINFWRFATGSDRKLHKINLLSLICVLPGKAIRAREKRKFRK